MPRLRPEAPAVDSLLSRLLWQALGLAALVIVLPPLTFGQALLGPVASAWLLALPAVAMLTLHRHGLAGLVARKRGQTPFPPAVSRRPVKARGKWGLTPSSSPSSSRARRGAFARAA